MQNKVIDKAKDAHVYYYFFILKYPPQSYSYDYKKLYELCSDTRTSDMYCLMFPGLTHKVHINPDFMKF